MSGETGRDLRPPWHSRPLGDGLVSKRWAPALHTGRWACLYSGRTPALTLWSRVTLELSGAGLTSPGYTDRPPWLEAALQVREVEDRGLEGEEEAGGAELVAWAEGSGWCVLRLLCHLSEAPSVASAPVVCTKAAAVRVGFGRPALTATAFVELWPVVGATPPGAVLASGAALRVAALNLSRSLLLWVTGEDAAVCLASTEVGWS